MGGSLVDSSAKGVSSSICLCHSTCEKAGFEHSSCACSGDGNFDTGIDFGQDELVFDEIGTAIAEVMHVCSDDDDEGTDSGKDSENEDPLYLESDSTDDVVDIDTELVTSPTFLSCNASEPLIDKSEYGNSSTNGTPLLVSAMKGSRAKRGIITRLSVSWAPDVYDPPVTSGSHTLKGHQRSSRKSHYKYKSTKSSSSRSSSGSKKDRKHSRHSSSSGSNHKRDRKPSYRNTIGGGGSIGSGSSSSNGKPESSAAQYRNVYSSSSRSRSRTDIAFPRYSKLSPLVPFETATSRNVYSSRTDIAVRQYSKLSPSAEGASLAGTVPVTKTLEPIKRNSSCCKEQPLSFLSRQFVAAKYRGMFSLWGQNQLAS